MGVIRFLPDNPLVFAQVTVHIHIFRCLWATTFIKHWLGLDQIGKGAGE